MSSLTAIDEARGWEAILRIVEGVPEESNRGRVRAFLKERRGNGIKLTTLGIDATAMRGLCLHLGEKKLQDVAKADLIAYVNNAKSIRAWRVKDKTGKERVTRKPIKLGVDTMGGRKGVLRERNARQRVLQPEPGQRGVFRRVRLARRVALPHGRRASDGQGRARGACDVDAPRPGLPQAPTRRHSPRRPGPSVEAALRRCADGPDLDYWVKQVENALGTLMGAEYERWWKRRLDEGWRHQALRAAPIQRVELGGGSGHTPDLTIHYADNHVDYWSLKAYSAREHVTLNIHHPAAKKESDVGPELRAFLQAWQARQAAEQDGAPSQALPPRPRLCLAYREVLIPNAEFFRIYERPDQLVPTATFSRSEIAGATTLRWAV